MIDTNSPAGDTRAPKKRHRNGVGVAITATLPQAQLMAHQALRRLLGDNMARKTVRRPLTNPSYKICCLATMVCGYSEAGYSESGE
jgi:hypothetical protein